MAFVKSKAAVAIEMLLEIEEYKEENQVTIDDLLGEDQAE